MTVPRTWLSIACALLVGAAVLSGATAHQQQQQAEQPKQPQHKQFGRTVLNENQRHLHRFNGATPLNVFVVPHTHDDVGWVNTPDVRLALCATPFSCSRRLTLSCIGLL